MTIKKTSFARILFLIFMALALTFASAVEAEVDTRSLRGRNGRQRKNRRPNRNRNNNNRNNNNNNNNNNRQRNNPPPPNNCPAGRGFNYSSRDPFCKINFKCAVGKVEFSTACGCGCQPQKCGAGLPACPATHACEMGACFLKN